MNFLRFFTSIGIVCAALVPALAQAEKTNVLVLPYSPLYDSIPRATGEQIARTLENGLRGNANVSLVKLSEGAAEEPGAGAKAATDAQKAAIGEAKAELERGASLMARRRVKPALDTFTAVIEKLVANHPAMENTDDLVEAYLRQGAALFLMGREDEAAAGPVQEALILNPGMRVEVSEAYGPPYVALIEKVRQEAIATRGVGSLRVDTTPPGALVWVDGREALTSPVLVTGLVPGTHYVTVKLPAIDAYTERIEITKDAQFHISPDEGEQVEQGAAGTLVSHLSQNSLDADAKAQLAAIAQSAGADVVVVGGAFADGAEMGIVSFLYSAAEDAVAPLQRITLNREMLGATIEINKVSTELVSRLSNFGTGMELPSPLAREAKAGAERINEVDMAIDFAALAKGEEEVRPAGPVQRRPAGPRRPIGAPVTPVTPSGGGEAPADIAGATSALEETPEAPAEEALAFADEPAASEPDFLDFNIRTDEPVAQEEERPSYTYSGGVSIADEVTFGEEPQLRKEPGLLGKWWFWTGAAVLVGGAVTAGVAMGGGDDGVTASAKW